MLGPAEKKFVAAENMQQRDMLDHIEKRQAEYKDLLATISDALASKAEVRVETTLSPLWGLPLVVFGRKSHTLPQKW